jgi:hypothetical protein
MSHDALCPPDGIELLLSLPRVIVPAVSVAWACRAAGPGSDRQQCHMMHRAHLALYSTTAVLATCHCPCLFSPQHGRVVLQDLAVTDSSEAMLSGRKPPFRLVVRAKRKGGQHLSIRPAVSEAFVVATRRVKTSHKVGFFERGPVVELGLHMPPWRTRGRGQHCTASPQVLGLWYMLHICCSQLGRWHAHCT